MDGTMCSGASSADCRAWLRCARMSRVLSLCKTTAGDGTSPHRPSQSYLLGDNLDWKRNLGAKHKVPLCGTRYHMPRRVFLRPPTTCPGASSADCRARLRRARTGRVLSPCRTTAGHGTSPHRPPLSCMLGDNLDRNGYAVRIRLHRLICDSQLQHWYR